jgi:hypothetical protein
LDDEVVVTAAVGHSTNARAILTTVAQDIKCVINLQHNCTDSQCTDTLQLAMRQERIETSRTIPTIRHKSTPNYFLNAYSIHDYSYICLIILETLHEIPLRVTNVAEVRTTVVQHMKEKKASKKAGDTLQEAERTENDIQDPLMPAPAFDNPPARPKTAAKPKAKAGTGSSTRGRKAASSRAGQAVAGPYGFVAPSTQKNPLVQSTSFVQHAQGQFTSPTNPCPPLQSFRPSIPHLHHPLQSHFPLAQPYFSAP